MWEKIINFYHILIWREIKMKKYASKKELYSDEVSKILIESNLICVDDHDFYKDYLLGVI